jgi:hypothetical protein
MAWHSSQLPLDFNYLKAARRVFTSLRICIAPNLIGPAIYVRTRTSGLGANGERAEFISLDTDSRS